MIKLSPAGKVARTIRPSKLAFQLLGQRVRWNRNDGSLLNSSRPESSSKSCTSERKYSTSFPRFTVPRAPISGLLPEKESKRSLGPTVTAPDPGPPRSWTVTLLAPPRAPATLLFASLLPEGPEVGSHQDQKSEVREGLRRPFSLGSLRELTPSADSCVASDFWSFDPISGPLGCLARPPLPSRAPCRARSLMHAGARCPRAFSRPRREGLRALLCILRSYF